MTDTSAPLRTNLILLISAMLPLSFSNTTGRQTHKMYMSQVTTLDFASTSGAPELHIAGLSVL